MNRQVQPVERARIGPVEVNFPAGELRKNGIRLKVHDQPLEILGMLVSRPGELVTREEIRQRLWPAGTFVDFDNGLNSAVNRLRSVLGDSAESPKFIQTIPRRGYRLIAPVGTVVLAQPIAPVDSVKIDRDQPNHRTNWVPRASVGAAVILCVLALALVLPSLRRLRPSNQIHSLSVAVSTTPEEDLQSQILAEAAGDSLIRGLRRAPKLRVFAERTVVSPGQALSIGRSLGCDAILLLESVRDGERLSIRIEMVSLKTTNHLWEETVTGRVADAAWVDANLVEVVVRHFNASANREKTAAVSSAAFQEYVRGRYFWNKRTPVDLHEAFASFRDAIRDDPNFSLAYAGLAQTYAVADLNDTAYRDREETYQEARDAADHAIAIDPNLASAHAARAQILRDYDRDMVAAEREYLKAIQLDADDPTTHQWYAEFLGMNGRFDQAIAEIDRAHELDPLSAVITAVCGTIRIWARHYKESLPFAEEALRLDPHYYNVYDNVARAMEEQGRYPEALAALTKKAEVSGDSRLAAAVREDKAAYGRGGPRALYRMRLGRFLSRSSMPDQKYSLALLYCRLGDVERCINSLEEAALERGEAVTGIKIDPAFDIIHNDPRYLALVRRFGFVP